MKAPSWKTDFHQIYTCRMRQRWLFALFFAVVVADSSFYDENANKWIQEILSAEENYEDCHLKNCSCFARQVQDDLEPFKSGISKAMLKETAQRGVHYQIIGGRVFRNPNCLFEARCEGVEKALLQISSSLPSLEFIVNVQDVPGVHIYEEALPLFSFSKDPDHIDILYPAWSFYAGGPAISLYPTGIGKWNETRESVVKFANKIEWSQRHPKAFFRGSRTNVQRDQLVLLSRRRPDLADARYTKNQAWRSIKDTLGEEPAKEVSFEEHCYYKYLFNFAGVAASFRLKHLLLCASTVFHVGNRWKEFFYSTLKPWVHYVPVSEQMTETEPLIKFAQKHDDLMLKIAHRGRKFVEDHLRIEDVLCYWKLLLTEYGKLLDYEVRRDPAFIRIR